MSNNYVLGGGITGLIFAFYNPDYWIISKDIGGQFKNKFNLGPRVLEENKYSRQFLKDLGIKIRRKIIKVGYCIEVGRKVKNRFDKSFIKDYFKKSRGIKYDGRENILNNGKSRMKVLSCDFDYVIEKLKHKTKDRIMNEEIIEVDIKGKKIKTPDNFFIYDKLVSSIPLPLMLKFCGLSEQGKQYKAESVTYVLLKKDFFCLGEFDFIYFSGKDIFHRLSKDKNKEFIVAEIRGEVLEDELRECFKKFYVESKIMKNIQLVAGKPLNKINKDIKLIGRYGTFNREWKTEKVVEESIKWQKNQV